MQALRTRVTLLRNAVARRNYSSALEEFPYPNVLNLPASYKPTPSEQARIKAAAEKAEVAAKEWAYRRAHEESHAVTTTDTWRKISYFVAIPITIAIAINSMVIMDHQHFKSEEEYVQYDHLRKRVKPFPWGDGDTPLFKGHHNY